MFDPKKYFSKAKQNYIANPLAYLGFKKYKTTCIARLTDENIFQFLNFQKSGYGGEQFTINVAIRPLFSAKNEDLFLLPGNRLGTMETGNDLWWKYSTEDTGNKSFQEIHRLLLKHALPFFEETTTSEGIINSFEENLFGFNKFGKKIMWGTEGWIDFDFAHIYLQTGDTKRALKHLKKSLQEFRKNNYEWAQKAVKDCIQLEAIINLGKLEVEEYLSNTIKTSEKNLQLESW